MRIGGAKKAALSKAAPATGETTISTEIRLLVKVGFLTVFAFSHRSTEIWRNGRLAWLAGETVEHGATLRVDGTATPEGFRVVSKAGPFIAASTTLTSNNLWTSAVLEQAMVIDAQHGGVIGISSRRQADEQIVVGGRSVTATRHSLITPYLAGTIWYDEGNQWVRGAFEHDGSRIQWRSWGVLLLAFCPAARRCRLRWRPRRSRLPRGRLAASTIRSATPSAACSTCRPSTRRCPASP